ncbi:uncharacterized protein F5147DRAFT_657288 [Suillus discolor]|uniref:Uncharacterized protein n=1 Tax=Suillus discolor TaxID=1912936 RepID=A0A9P7JP76_9AGAM|nr:uncharacterized protein F5147DRAFT_657288 [Suillus discolor]KAG2094047.1 hypothetical protein F5147DRAFT_657288 [Suillus discolor]
MVFVPHCLHQLRACWILANLMVLGLLAVLPYTPFYLLTSAVWPKQCQYARQRQYTDQHVMPAYKWLSMACYINSVNSTAEIVTVVDYRLNSSSLQMLEIVYCNGSNASCTHTSAQQPQLSIFAPAIIT